MTHASSFGPTKEGPPALQRLMIAVLASARAWTDVQAIAGPSMYLGGRLD